VLWGLLRRAHRLSEAGGRGEHGPVDVTVPGDGGRAHRKGIRVHRSAALSPARCTRRERIPVTNPARTLEDLRRTLPSPVFASAVRQAEYLGLPLDELPTDHTPSQLEARFLTLLRRHRILRPEVNVGIDRFVVDFLWRNARLVVELDGWKSHGTRTAFEEDRARDARLNLLGYQVVRFTWRQIEDDVATVIRTIRTLLRTPSTLDS